VLQFLLREFLWQRQSLQSRSHQRTRLVPVGSRVGVEIPDDEGELLGDFALRQAMLRCGTGEETDDGAELGEFRADLLEEEIRVEVVDVLELEGERGRVREL
jgi:hypothetical protein